MIGMARSTTVCKVCGQKIVKGVHTVQWQDGVKSSSRHDSCFGKPDRFAADGSPLDKDGLETVPTPKTRTNPPIPIESAPVAPAPPSSDPMAQMLAAALAPHLKGLVDENKVRQIVKEVATAKSQEEIRTQEALIKRYVDNALTERGTLTIAVRQSTGSTTVLEGLQHKETPKLLKVMLRRKNAYLYGPTGSGKSTAAKKCAAAIKTEAHPDGLPFYYVSLNPQSSPTRIEGYQNPSGSYVETLFRRAYEHGGVFCADEVDNSAGNLWTSVNNAIDSNLGSFPDGMVKRHPDFIFVGTGNTNLSGDAVYRDRKALDKATIARFTFLHWAYDLGMERVITVGRNAKALPWLQWVHRARAWATVSNPAMFAYLHPRACYDGADLLADGFNVIDVFNMTVAKGTFDETAVRAALQACPLPTESMEIAA